MISASIRVQGLPVSACLSTMHDGPASSVRSRRCDEKDATRSTDDLSCRSPNCTVMAMGDVGADGLRSGLELGLGGGCG